MGDVDRHGQWYSTVGTKVIIAHSTASYLVYICHQPCSAENMG